MTEFDAIVLLVVATGYLLTIKKKQPPIPTNERLFQKITTHFGKMPSWDVSFYIYYNSPFPRLQVFFAPLLFSVCETMYFLLHDRGNFLEFN